MCYTSKRPECEEPTCSQQVEKGRGWCVLSQRYDVGAGKISHCAYAQEQLKWWCMSDGASVAFHVGGALRWTKYEDSKQPLGASVFASILLCRGGGACGIERYLANCPKELAGRRRRRTAGVGRLWGEMGFAWVS